MNQGWDGSVFSIKACPASSRNTSTRASWCAGSISVKQHAPGVCSCCWIGEVQRVLKAGSGNDWSNRVRGTADQLSVKTADGCCTLVASGIWMAQNANKIASEYTLYFCTLLFFFVCLYFTIVLLHLMDSGWVSSQPGNPDSSEDTWCQKHLYAAL